jgi:hypothetical protein
MSKCIRLVQNKIDMEHLNFRSITGNLIILIILLNLQSPVKAQTTSDGSAPQFLFPGFSMGRVKMKNGNVQSIVMNYNTVSEKMVYKKDDNLYDMLNTEMIDTVFIQESKFIPAGKVFYEVLLTAHVSLFIQYKGELIPPGTVAGYGGTSQVSNTNRLASVNLSMGYYNLPLPKDYTVKVDLIFWIIKDNSMVSYTTERQFLKIFPDKGEELKQFIRKSRIKFDNISDQVQLAIHYNELTR